MTDILAQVHAVLTGVTDGPWTWEDDCSELMPPGGSHFKSGARPVITVDCYSESVFVENAADAEFIAWARTGVPALAAELKAARAENERLRAHWEAYG